MAVYKRKNNKWYCSFMIKGQRVHKLLNGAKTKEEAKELEDAERFKIRQIQNGLVDEKKKEKVYTFSFMMRKYLDTVIANNKTYKASAIFAKYLTDFFGANTDILKIKPSDFDKFKRHLLKKGRTKATINRYKSAMQRAYNIMIIDDLITYNPMTKVKKLEEDNKRYRYLSKDEWERLKEELPQYLKDIVTFTLYTGYRLSNVLYFKWEQVDFNLRTIELLKQENKGAKKIVTPISDGLLELLYSLKPKKKGYIFINPDTGKPYTTIKKGFSNALKKAGIEDFHFHDLRRTVGTWLNQEGVDIRTIQNILAHSDVSTTERYLSLTPEQNRKAMGVLNSLV